MRRFPNLDLARYTETSLDVHNTLAAAVLDKSNGFPTMSDEDMKIAIVSLINTCRAQQRVIDELVTYVNDERAPKPKKKIRIPFKK